MDDIAKLKNQILIYSLITAVVVELVSLPILGWDAKFLYGLVLGTVVSILAFSVLVWSARRTLKQGKKSLSVVGYMIRLILYGAAFLAGIKLSIPAGIAAVIGILTTKAALLIVYGIKPKFDKDRKVPEHIRKEYEQRDREREEHRTDTIRDRIRRELSYPDRDEERKPLKEVRLKRRTYKTHRRIK